MIAWFTRRAGDPHRHVAEIDQGALLYGDLTPNFVRLPVELGAAHGGGEVRRVLVELRGPCPVVGCSCTVPHLDLDGGLSVAECGMHGFCFYRTPA